MAILTRDDITRARRWSTSCLRTGYLATNAGFWGDMFDLTGSLNGPKYPDNTTTGVLMSNTSAGAVPLPAHKDNEKIYLVGTDNTNLKGSYVQTDMLFDSLWRVGAFADTSLHTFTNQPSYEARLPTVNGAVCWGEAELWLNTKFLSGVSMSIVVGYTNQDGVDTFSPSYQFGTIQYGTMLRIPLASGDYGVQKVNSCQLTNRTSGDFSIEVNRILQWSYIDGGFGRSICFRGELTGIVEVHPSACLHRITMSGGGQMARPTYNRYDFLVG